MMPSLPPLPIRIKGIPPPLCTASNAFGRPAAAAGKPEAADGVPATVDGTPAAADGTPAAADGTPEEVAKGGEVAATTPNHAALAMARAESLRRQSVQGEQAKETGQKRSGPDGVTQPSRPKRNSKETGN
jgi:hypothetical protein